MALIIHFLKPVLLTKAMVDMNATIEIQTIRVHVRWEEDEVVVSTIEPLGHNRTERLRKGDTCTIELATRVYNNRTRERIT